MIVNSRIRVRCAWVVTLGLVTSSAFAEPADIRLVVPSRMINDKTLTIIAELLDANGDIDWRTWTAFGTVSAVRTDTQEPVPLSIIVFDLHNGPPPEDSIRFYNGWGSVSITLDNGAQEPAGDIDITVEYLDLQRTKTVTLLDNPTTLEISGALSGTDLDWGPEDGVIHVVGPTSVPSGQTLSIAPGTLVMVDPGPNDDGTRVTVNGSVNSVGTQEDPVYMFTSAGAAGMRLMELCSEPRSNYSSWRGFWHPGSGNTSRYEYTIVTGAGNGSVEGHARPPLWRFSRSHSFEMDRCFFVDNPGKCIHGTGSGSYHISRSLFSRSGHGVNWQGRGNYTLLVEDSMFSGLGHGQFDPDCGIDGDCMNLRADEAGNDGGKTIRRTIFVDGGDDAIDTFQTSPLIENCIVSNMRDKGVSMEGVDTDIVVRNMLGFGCQYGFDGHVNSAFSLEHVTLAFEEINPLIRVHGGTTVDQCIFWPQAWNTCRSFETLSYTLVGIGADTSCGVGNFAADPRFENANSCGFSLQQGSPALYAGPSGGRIGWLGFPEPFACVTDDHCNDGDECTADSCQDGVCLFDRDADCFTAIFPDTFDVTRGVLLGGTIEDLLNSDDQYVTISARLPSDIASASAELEVTGTSPFETATEIRFRIEAATTGSPSWQVVELFNYQTGEWVRLDRRDGLVTDRVVVVAVSTDTDQFIEPGTLEMKARVGFLDLGITFPGWIGRYDHAFWNVDP